MQQPPPQPPPGGEPYGEPTQPIGHPPYPYNEPTQTPSQLPDTAYGQPLQGQEQPAPPAQGAPFAQPPPPPGAPFAQPSQAPAPGAAPGRAGWVAFSRLRGHPLIDISEGKTIGTVHDLLLDQQRRAIQAFATKGKFLRGTTLVPAARATIGADAVTFQPGTLAGQDTSWLEDLPKASQLIGMRVHSNTGQLLGTVEDLRIDRENARLMALELVPEQTGIPHRIGSARRLLPADSVVSYGPDTIIAMEGGITEL
jgi:sporulation protein YlmC with PRC-barrel domain